MEMRISTLRHQFRDLEHLGSDFSRIQGPYPVFFPGHGGHVTKILSGVFKNPYNFRFNSTTTTVGIRAHHCITQFPGKISLILDIILQLRNILPKRGAQRKLRAVAALQRAHPLHPAVFHRFCTPRHGQCVLWPSECLFSCQDAKSWQDFQLFSRCTIGGDQGVPVQDQQQEKHEACSRRGEIAQKPRNFSKIIIGTRKLKISEKWCPNYSIYPINSTKISHQSKFRAIQLGLGSKFRKVSIWARNFRQL